jgi:hypothetical protein
MAIRTDLFDTNPKCLTSAWCDAPEPQKRGWRSVATQENFTEVLSAAPPRTIINVLPAAAIPPPALTNGL